MISGDINTLNLNGDITTSIGLNGDLDNEIKLDTTISSVDSLDGDVLTSIGLDGSLDNDIMLEATINPITQSTNDYNRLVNKPKINSIELIENKSLDDLNIQIKGDYPDEALTNTDIEDLLNNFF